MAPIDLDGIWKNVKNENLDNFLKALNLNFAVRKMAATQSPVLEISQKGDVFKIITKGLKTFETNFTVGQEYTDRNPLNDKEPSTYLPMWDGDKLRTENKSHPDAIHFVRELIDGQMVQTQTVGTGDKAVVCKRIFAKK
ncbi:fatty acid-binding protein, brain-like [Patiria miniata]|uniref:Lipocalin/cytosolic fatty-acid binding domain-containing protein n=1 Tax=Patiria miniata TaxID=46514 RepID=A0A914A8J8_PATMI|nr:fatty acid-binding protein, brain-like [Patiria miniata]